MKEGLEADHVKMHREETRNMREGMGDYNEKRIREALKWARDKILNNGSAGITNDDVPDLSMPSPMSE